RNQDHGQTVGADRSTPSCVDQNVGRKSEFCAARCARERDHVADVRHTGNEHQHSLEAEAETGVWNGTVTPQIEIPLVINRIHVVTTHVLLQYVEPLFTLAAPDDFADSRHEQIHCSHSLSVIVHTHVKRFDFL